MKPTLNTDHIKLFSSIVTASLNGSSDGDKMIVGINYIDGEKLFTEFVRMNPQYNFSRSKMLDGRVVYTNNFRGIIITDQYNVSRYPVYIKSDIITNTTLF